MVLRATWAEDTITAKSFLELIRKRRGHLRADDLDRIDALKKSDQPPEDKWAGR